MGQMDLPLTARGRAEAEALAGWLSARGVSFGRVYASDLRRAVDTAAPIAAACGGRTVVIRPELRELGRGLVEGRTVAEAGELRRLPGITESFEPEPAVAARIERVGRELRAAALEADVAAVAHGGSIGRLMHLYLGLPGGRPDGPRFRIANTGLTRIEFQHGSAEVICVNTLYHLGGDPPPGQD